MAFKNHATDYYTCFFKLVEKVVELSGFYLHSSILVLLVSGYYIFCWNVCSVCDCIIILFNSNVGLPWIIRLHIIASFSSLTCALPK